MPSLQTARAYAWLGTLGAQLEALLAAQSVLLAPTLLQVRDLALLARLVTQLAALEAFLALHAQLALLGTLVAQPLVKLVAQDVLLAPTLLEATLRAFLA